VLEIMPQRHALDVARISLHQALERGIRRQDVLRLGWLLFLFAFLFLGIGRAGQENPTDEARTKAWSAVMAPAIDANFAAISHMVSALHDV